MLFAGSARLNAQVITDTVSLGAGYANQVWYSLENDEQGNAPKNNWDIAFDASGYGTSVHINSVAGTELWKYPVADTAGWSTLDTAGLSAWPKAYNSDTSWARGAFDQGMNPGNPFDLGWGIYNPVTHIVSGDSLFVIKLANGSYKKLRMDALNAGVYTFTYADLNGNNQQTASLSKTNYAGKNFGYYSLQNNAPLDREPLSANWDLVFTQYTAFLPQAYAVTGILHNSGITTAHAEPVANPASYVSWTSHPFNSAINEIGFDWKTFTSSWAIDDSLVYFVQTADGAVWKVIPTGFGGSMSGNFIFTKEKLSAASLTENGITTVVLAVYPNPAGSDGVYVMYALEQSVLNVQMQLRDISGKAVFTASPERSAGLHTAHLNTAGIAPGLYMLTVEAGNQVLQQKIIIR